MFPHYLKLEIKQSCNIHSCYRFSIIISNKYFITIEATKKHSTLNWELSGGIFIYYKGGMCIWEWQAPITEFLPQQAGSEVFLKDVVQILSPGVWLLEINKTIQKQIWCEFSLISRSETWCHLAPAGDPSLSLHPKRQAGTGTTWLLPHLESAQLFLVLDSWEMPVWLANICLISAKLIHITLASQNASG